jgi:hypothetical protein
MFFKSQWRLRLDRTAYHQPLRNAPEYSDAPLPRQALKVLIFKGFQPAQKDPNRPEIGSCF